MSQARRTFSRNRLIALGLNQDAADAVKSGEMVATVLQTIVTGTKSAIEQLNSVITTGETGKPDEKQSIDCVLITKENADKLDNFVLSE